MFLHKIKNCRYVQIVVAFIKAFCVNGKQSKKPDLSFDLPNELPAGQRRACVRQPNIALRKKFEEQFKSLSETTMKNRMALDLFKAQNYPDLFEEDTGLNAKDYIVRMLRVREMLANTPMIKSLDT